MKIRFFNNIEKAMAYALARYRYAMREAADLDLDTGVRVISKDNMVFPNFCAFEYGDETFYSCAFLNKKQKKSPIDLKHANSPAYWNAHSYDAGKNGVLKERIPLNFDIKI